MNGLRAKGYGVIPWTVFDTIIGYPRAQAKVALIVVRRAAGRWEAGSVTLGGRTVKLRSGQCIVGRYSIGKEFNVDPGVVVQALRRMNADGIILPPSLVPGNDKVVTLAEYPEAWTTEGYTMSFSTTKSERQAPRQASHQVSAPSTTKPLMADSSVRPADSERKAIVVPTSPPRGTSGSRHHDHPQASSHSEKSENSRIQEKEGSPRDSETTSKSQSWMRRFPPVFSLWPIKIGQTAAEQEWRRLTPSGADETAMDAHAGRISRWVSFYLREKKDSEKRVKDEFVWFLRQNATSFAAEPPKHTSHEYVRPEDRENRMLTLEERLEFELRMAQRRQEEGQEEQARHYDRHARELMDEIAQRDQLTATGAAVPDTLAANGIDEAERPGHFNDVPDVKRRVSKARRVGINMIRLRRDLRAEAKQRAHLEKIEEQRLRFLAESAVSKS